MKSRAGSSGAFASGGCDLVPAHFSEVPLLLRRDARNPLVLAAASPPDRHGYVSLGTNADYTARLVEATCREYGVRYTAHTTFLAPTTACRDECGRVECGKQLGQFESLVSQERLPHWVAFDLRRRGSG